MKCTSPANAMVNSPLGRAGVLEEDDEGAADFGGDTESPVDADAEERGGADRDELDVHAAAASMRVSTAISRRDLTPSSIPNGSPVASAAPGGVAGSWYASWMAGEFVVGWVSDDDEPRMEVARVEVRGDELFATGTQVGAVYGLHYRLEPGALILEL